MRYSQPGLESETLSKNKTGNEKRTSHVHKAHCDVLRIYSQEGWKQWPSVSWLKKKKTTHSAYWSLPGPAHRGCVWVLSGLCSMVHPWCLFLFFKRQLFTFFFMHTNVFPMCIYVPNMHAWCLRKSEEDFRSPGTHEWVAVSHYVDAWNGAWILCKNTKCS